MFESGGVRGNPNREMDSDGSSFFLDFRRVYLPIILRKLTIIILYQGARAARYLLHPELSDIPEQPFATHKV